MRKPIVFSRLFHGKYSTYRTGVTQSWKYVGVCRGCVVSDSGGLVSGFGQLHVGWVVWRLSCIVVRRWRRVSVTGLHRGIERVRSLRAIKGSLAVWCRISSWRYGEKAHGVSMTIINKPCFTCRPKMYYCQGHDWHITVRSLYSFLISVC